jgi:tellurite resistance protein
MSKTTFSSLTEDERETLLKAPVIIFLMVAAMDGKVEAKEVKGFLIAVRDLADGDSELLRGIFLESGANFPAILNQTLSTSADAGRILIDAKQIIETKLPAGEAKLFKQSLLLMGQKVAEFSGTIGKEEKAALAAVATILEVTV